MHALSEPVRSSKIRISNAISLNIYVTVLCQCETWSDLSCDTHVLAAFLVRTKRRVHPFLDVEVFVQELGVVLRETNDSDTLPERRIGRRIEAQ